MFGNIDLSNLFPYSAQNNPTTLITAQSFPPPLQPPEFNTEILPTELWFKIFKINIFETISNDSQNLSNESQNQCLVSKSWSVLYQLALYDFVKEIFKINDNDAPSDVSLAERLNFLHVKMKRIFQHFQEENINFPTNAIIAKTKILFPEFFHNLITQYAKLLFIKTFFTETLKRKRDQNSQQSILQIYFNNTKRFVKRGTCLEKAKLISKTPLEFALPWPQREWSELQCKMVNIHFNVELLKQLSILDSKYSIENDSVEELHRKFGQLKKEGLELLTNPEITIDNFPALAIGVIYDALNTDPKSLLKHKDVIVKALLDFNLRLIDVLQNAGKGKLVLTIPFYELGLNLREELTKPAGGYGYALRHNIEGVKNQPRDARFNERYDLKCDTITLFHRLLCTNDVDDEFVDQLKNLLDNHPEAKNLEQIVPSLYDDLFDPYQDNLRTALHYVCMHSGNLKLIKLLIKCGGNPLLKDSYDRTALHYLMLNKGNEDAVKFLLSKGLNPFLIDRNKNNCMHTALELQHFEYVEIFRNDPHWQSESRHSDPAKFSYTTLAFGKIQLFNTLIDEGFFCNVSSLWTYLAKMRNDYNYSPRVIAGFINHIVTKYSNLNTRDFLFTMNDGFIGSVLELLLLRQKDKETVNLLSDDFFKKSKLCATEYMSKSLNTIKVDNTFLPVLEKWLSFYSHNELISLLTSVKNFPYSGDRLEDQIRYYEEIKNYYIAMIEMKIVELEQRVKTENAQRALQECIYASYNHVYQNPLQQNVAFISHYGQPMITYLPVSHFPPFFNASQIPPFYYQPNQLSFTPSLPFPPIDPTISMLNLQPELAGNIVPQNISDAENQS